jgi:hypothetical protein
MTGTLISVGVGLIFAAVGVVMLLVGRRERAQAKAASAWPTVGGTVTSSRIDHQTRTQRRQGRTYTRTTYTPVVEYTYSVGSQALRGTRIFPGATMSYDLGTAQGIVNRYQAGQPATVHYDPAEPGNAVLETSARSGNLLMILGGIFTAIGVVVLVAAGITGFLL